MHFSSYQYITNVMKTLTIVLLLQIVAGAIEFKLGFSGLRLSQDQMASNIKVSSLKQRDLNTTY
jgi:hypothetical protein